MVGDKELYRKRRNGLGWLLAAGWIIYWWSKPTDGTIVGGAGHLMMELVSVVSAPFAFVVSHYVARLTVEAQERGADRADEAAARVRQHAVEADRARTLLASETATEAAKQSIDRGEIIRKLGSVNDLLDLLPTAGVKRQVLIRQNVAQELRDLVAKHTLPELSALMQGDASAGFALRAALRRLAELGPLSADALTLQMALDERDPALLADR